MEQYTFSYDGKELVLHEGNCIEFYNDEEQPVEGLSLPQILQLLKEYPDVTFDLEYYNGACPSCLAGKEEKAKVFKFLAYNFSVYTLERQYVISSISKDKDATFSQMLKHGKVDNSYSVSVVVCPSCGDYSIEILECEV
ncbi:hypothetical protein BHU72_13010 [Desulfuribacillus stibiiarsenatis]|uniref:DUF3785 domain-containing protein n=1 Tax=Desulfuribacillus stibiiarsenatis TaxID=1390249 RepID=A0A1E5L8Q6_9FIRM|nr:DUF3785 family protein [Desulfuribacillus stibiiarsenatis]OEH86525.1 hypothetical protein BHU72_13010 [Desulfuribacillus stibiiarsenatis]